MINFRIYITCIVLIAGVAHPLSAQDYDAMLQQQMQQFNQLGQQMQQYETNVVQQNMQNPQIQAMYQNYLVQGGTMSFEQFAYNYAATGGYTQEGMAYYQQNERNIQQQEQAALNAYRQNQAQNAQAMQQMHQRNADIAHQRGNLLNGTTDYYDSSNNTQYNLPHTIQPNTNIHNAYTGEDFYRDGQGNYHREDADGWQYDLEEVE